MKLATTLALVGTLLAAGTTASLAAETIGDDLASGKISAPAVRQLIVGTGLSFDEAKAYTVEEIVKLRWEDS